MPVDKEHGCVYECNKGIKCECPDCSICEYYPKKEVVKEFTESQLYEEYGYLMDPEHGKDTELLMDIMKCNRLNVEEKNGKYLILDK